MDISKNRKFVDSRHGTSGVRNIPEQVIFVRLWQAKGFLP